MCANKMRNTNQKNMLPKTTAVFKKNQFFLTSCLVCKLMEKPFQLWKPSIKTVTCKREFLIFSYDIALNICEVKIKNLVNLLTFPWSLLWFMNTGFSTHVTYKKCMKPFFKDTSIRYILKETYFWGLIDYEDAWNLFLSTH